MKNAALFIFSFLLMGFTANATSNNSPENYRRGYDGSAYTFVEGDVEFSVFPDGQFDFVYVGPQSGSQVTISTPNVNVSFNSGYDYDAYVQYDDYGAVIQIESVPIYYDEYGRITQAGNVDIRYNDRRIVRVGGLHVIYNNYGYFSHCTGAINFYNPYYVYRPWHVYYVRPIYSHCIVYDRPYRRYYNPIRYSYHDHILYYKNRNRVAYHNTRRDFYRPGSRVYDKRGRASINKNYNPNRKNTMIAQNTRNSRNSFSKDSRSNNKGAITRNSKTNRSNTVSQNSRNKRNKVSTAPNRNNIRNVKTSKNRKSVQTRAKRNSTNHIKRNNTVSKRKTTTVRSNKSRNVQGSTRVVKKQQARKAPSHKRKNAVTRTKSVSPKRSVGRRTSTVSKSAKRGSFGKSTSRRGSSRGRR
jgi:hypothetical protein